MTQCTAKEDTVKQYAITLFQSFKVYFKQVTFKTLIGFQGSYWFTRYIYWHRIDILFNIFFTF